jgi:hypothetical protein
MQLALEAACFARGFGERLVAAYHGLAAECAFELWWRDEGYSWATANATTTTRPPWHPMIRVETRTAQRAA